MLSDSSPQMNFDWLWVMYDEVDVEKMPGIFEAVLELSALTIAMAPTDADDMDNVFQDDVFSERWWDLHPVLMSVGRHVCIPTGMTSGHRGIPHRASAMTHTLSIELIAAGDLHHIMAR